MTTLEKKDMNENILYFWNLLLGIERYPVTHDVTHIEQTHMINIRRNAHSLLLQLFYYYSCNNKRYLFIKKGKHDKLLYVCVYVHHYKIPRGCE